MSAFFYPKLFLSGRSYLNTLISLGSWPLLGSIVVIGDFVQLNDDHVFRSPPTCAVPLGHRLGRRLDSLSLSRRS